MGTTISAVAARPEVPVLTDVLPYLRCPVCRRSLAAAGQTLRCPAGHAFDVARQGYVNLAPGGVTHPGDSATMVAAREQWLATGGYDFLGAALAGQVSEVAGLVVDAGAGTGHHLAAVLAAHPAAVGLAVDVSKPALRRAARAHHRAAAVLADSWRSLPVADRAAALMLNVFAPRNGAEFARVLAGDGVLLVVTPTARHLVELVDTVALLRVPTEKADQVTAGLAPWFRPAGDQVHTRSLALTHAQVRTVVGMGPSAHHTDPRQLDDALGALAEPVRITAEVRVARYRPRH
jgi:23S rRNA (guanine745-N1)-methyltransferase